MNSVDILVAENVKDQFLPIRFYFAAGPSKPSAESESKVCLQINEQNNFLNILFTKMSRRKSKGGPEVQPVRADVNQADSPWKSIKRKAMKLLGSTQKNNDYFHEYDEWSEYDNVRLNSQQEKDGRNRYAKYENLDISLRPLVKKQQRDGGSQRSPSLSADRYSLSKSQPPLESDDESPDNYDDTEETRYPGRAGYGDAPSPSTLRNSDQIKDVQGSAVEGNTNKQSRFGNNQNDQKVNLDDSQQPKLLQSQSQSISTTYKDPLATIDDDEEHEDAGADNLGGQSPSPYLTNSKSASPDSQEGALKGRQNPTDLLNASDRQLFPLTRNVPQVAAPPARSGPPATFGTSAQDSVRDVPPGRFSSRNTGDEIWGDEEAEVRARVGTGRGAYLDEGGGWDSGDFDTDRKLTLNSPTAAASENFGGDAKLLKRRAAFLGPEGIQSESSRLDLARRSLAASVGRVGRFSVQALVPRPLQVYGNLLWFTLPHVLPLSLASLLLGVVQALSYPVLVVLLSSVVSDLIRILADAFPGGIDVDSDVRPVDDALGGTTAFSDTRDQLQEPHSFKRLLKSILDSVRQSDNLENNVGHTDGIVEDFPAEDVNVDLSEPGIDVDVPEDVLSPHISTPPFPSRRDVLLKLHGSGHRESEFSEMLAHLKLGYYDMITSLSLKMSRFGGKYFLSSLLRLLLFAVRLLVRIRSLAALTSAVIVASSLPKIQSAVQAKISRSLASIVKSNDMIGGGSGGESSGDALGLSDSSSGYRARYTKEVLAPGAVRVISAITSMLAHLVLSGALLRAVRRSLISVSPAAVATVFSYISSPGLDLDVDMSGVASGPGSGVDSALGQTLSANIVAASALILLCPYVIVLVGMVAETYGVTYSDAVSLTPGSDEGDHLDPQRGVKQGINGGLDAKAKHLQYVAELASTTEGRSAETVDRWTLRPLMKRIVADMSAANQSPVSARGQSHADGYDGSSETGAVRRSGAATRSSAASPMASIGSMFLSLFRATAAPHKDGHFKGVDIYGKSSGVVGSSRRFLVTSSLLLTILMSFGVLLSEVFMNLGVGMGNSSPTAPYDLYNRYLNSMIADFENVLVRIPYLGPKLMYFLSSFRGSSQLFGADIGVQNNKIRFLSVTIPLLIRGSLILVAPYMLWLSFLVARSELEGNLWAAEQLLSQYSNGRMKVKQEQDREDVIMKQQVSEPDGWTTDGPDPRAGIQCSKVTFKEHGRVVLKVWAIPCTAL